MEPPDVCYDDYGMAYGSDYAEDDVSMEYHGPEYGDYEAYEDPDNEQLFEKMWPTVEQMCREITKKPNEWVLDNYTLTHKPTKLQYWTGSSNTSAITEIYTAGNTKRIFSEEQGKLIRASLKDRRLHTPSPEQLEVMKAFGTDPVPFKPEPGFFGNLWAAIKFFPILVKFCVGYRA